MRWSKFRIVCLKFNVLFYFLQHEIKDAPYGQDVSSVEQLYKEQQTKHEEVMNLREDVEKACKQSVRRYCMHSGGEREWRWGGGGGTLKKSSNTTLT